MGFVGECLRDSFTWVGQTELQAEKAWPLLVTQSETLPVFPASKSCLHGLPGVPQKSGLWGSRALFTM